MSVLFMLVQFRSLYNLIYHSSCAIRHERIVVSLPLFLTLSISLFFSDTTFIHTHLEYKGQNKYVVWIAQSCWSCEYKPKTKPTKQPKDMVEYNHSCIIHVYTNSRVNLRGTGWKWWTLPPNSTHKRDQLLERATTLYSWYKTQVAWLHEIIRCIAAFFSTLATYKVQTYKPIQTSASSSSSSFNVFDRCVAPWTGRIQHLPLSTKCWTMMRMMREDEGGKVESFKRCGLAHAIVKIVSYNCNYCLYERNSSFLFAALAVAVDDACSSLIRWFDAAKVLCVCVCACPQVHSLKSLALCWFHCTLTNWNPESANSKLFLINKKKQKKNTRNDNTRYPANPTIYKK